MRCVGLVVGDEALLVEEAVRGFLGRFSGAEVLRFEKELDLGGVLGRLGQNGLFSSSVLIVVREPWFLGKAVSEAELGVLNSIFEAVSAGGHGFLMIAQRLDKRKKVVKQVLKLAELTECQGFLAWEQDKLYAWIRARVEGYGKQVSRDGILALEASAGTQLSGLAQLIDALVTYLGDAGEILDSHVRDFSSEFSSSSFSLMDALKSHDRAKMLLSADSLMRHGEDAVGLLALVASQIRLYLQILVILDSGGTAQSIAKAVGKNPYYVQKLLPEIRKAYSLSDLKQGMNRLAEMDLGIKSGKIAASRALELVLAGI